MAAGQAKNRFGELLERAQRGPVRIEKHGRAVAVVLSAEDYDTFEKERLQSLRAEIQRGLADLEAGRSLDGEAAVRNLRKRLKK